MLLHDSNYTNINHSFPAFIFIIFSQILFFSCISSFSRCSYSVQLFMLLLVVSILKWFFPNFFQSSVSNLLLLWVFLFLNYAILFILFSVYFIKFTVFICFVGIFFWYVFTVLLFYSINFYLFGLQYMLWDLNEILFCYSCLNEMSFHIQLDIHVGCWREHW